MVGFPLLNNMSQVYSVSQGKIIDQPDPMSSPSMQSGAPAVQTPPPIQQPVTPQPSLSVNNAVGTPTPTQSQQPTTITGHTLAEHASALEAAKAANDPTAVKQITDDYNRENDYQKSFIQPTVMKEQAKADTQQAADKKTADAKQLAMGKTQGAVHNLLDTYTSLPGLEKGNPLSGFISDHLPTQAAEYENQRKALGATLKDIAGAGAGSGVRVTQSELNAWGNLLPSASKTPAQNQIDLISLDRQMKNNFGQGVGADYLQKFGVQTDGKGNYTKGQDHNIPLVNRLVGGAVNDAGGVLKGVASLPDAVINSENRNQGSPGGVISDLAARAGKGIVNEYGSLVGAKTANGQPILDPNKSVFQKGGVNPITGLDVGSAINHAIDHPLNTALDIIPASGVVKGLKGTSVAADAGNAGKGLDVANAVGKTNPVANIIRNTADLVNGGGSKDYVANQARNPNMVPQNQVLMDEGILSHPTETGRIQATANSMKNVGGQLQSAYANSDRVFKGTQLSDTLTQKLTDAGYDPKAVNMMKTYINKQGNFDLNSGDNLITMEKAWQTAQKLEQNPPKIIGTPESASAIKQLAMTTAKILRGEIATRVPDTLPLNAKYGALRDYFDNTLSDPEGLNVHGGGGAHGGIVNTVLNAGKSVINPVLNTAYKATGDRTGTKLIRDKRMNAINPMAFRQQASQ